MQKYSAAGFFVAKKWCFCYAGYIKRLICSDVILILRKVQGIAYDKKEISNIYVDINTGDDRRIDDQGNKLCAGRI